MDVSGMNFAYVLYAKFSTYPFSLFLQRSMELAPLQLFTMNIVTFQQPSMSTLNIMLQ
jgi:hypothetical protein